MNTCHTSNLGRLLQFSQLDELEQVDFSREVHKDVDVTALALRPPDMGAEQTDQLDTIARCRFGFAAADYIDDLLLTHVIEYAASLSDFPSGAPPDSLL